MALSIGKSQKNNIIWLDQIGSSKSSFAPVKLNHIEKALYTLAAKFKTLAEDNLSVQDAVNSGKLGDSIQWDEVEFMGGKYTVSIKVLDYYKFIDQGVRGTESGSSKGGFQFKSKYPSKKMMEAIRKWVIREGLKVRTKPARNSPLGQERKGSRFKNVDKTSSLAYAIATNIKKKGIRGTDFFTDAGKKIEKDFREQANEVFEIAIINEIIS